MGKRGQQMRPDNSSNRKKLDHLVEFFFMI